MSRSRLHTRTSRFARSTALFLFISFVSAALRRVDSYSAQIAIIILRDALTLADLSLRPEAVTVTEVAGFELPTTMLHTTLEVIPVFLRVLQPLEKANEGGVLQSIPLSALAQASSAIVLCFPIWN